MVRENNSGRFFKKQNDYEAKKDYNSEVLNRGQQDRRRREGQYMHDAEAPRDRGAEENEELGIVRVRWNSSMVPGIRLGPSQAETEEILEEGL